MNLLEEIEARLGTIAEYVPAEGIRSAVRHIAIAEKYLRRGRDDQDDDFFNDVIYRSNQAFEGMLEEAYETITGESSAEKSIAEIEKRFQGDAMLSERLIVAIQRYRREWRNDSTHDHKALFSEQEALLAIVSVSAFAVVLLDQIIQSVSYDRQRTAAEQEFKEVQQAFLHYAELDLDTQVTTLLMAFSASLRVELSEGRVLAAGAELVGSLAGYLTARDHELTARASVQISGREVDLLLEKRGISAPLEVRRGGTGGFLDAAAENLKLVLDSGGFRLGFVFVPPRSKSDVMRTARIDWAGQDRAVDIVAPDAFVSHIV